MGGIIKATVEGLWRILMALLPLLGTSGALGATDRERAQSRFSSGKVLQREQETVRLLSQAMDPCPGFIRPHERAGNWHRNKGESDRAADCFAKAIQRRLEASGFHEVITLLDREATQRRILTLLGFEFPWEVARRTGWSSSWRATGRRRTCPTGACRT
jgi:hypothetical protein